MDIQGKNKTSLEDHPFMAGIHFYSKYVGKMPSCILSPTLLISKGSVN